MRDYRTKYERERAISLFVMVISRRLPRRLKAQVFADVTNEHFFSSGEVMSDIRAVDALQNYGDSTLSSQQMGD